MKNNIQNLKGFRDFLPNEKSKRDFIENKIKETFETFGFLPVETPTLEYAELLLGKYGDEADKLVYSFKDRGDREVALRYDQTVPTARLLVQYQNELPKFFRRYQIQDVFRADKPQKGRFREFKQCDIDVFGSTSPLADAEILACTYQVFKNIGFENIILKVNDRQVLMKTLNDFASNKIDVFSIIQSVDKLDKMSEQDVISELIDKGLDEKKAAQALEQIKKAKISENLAEILKASQKLGVPEKALQFEPTLARGLDYYTSLIFEVIVPEYGVGSLGGGGRYDNLIESLSGLKMPAVGIGLGFDRIVEAADEMGLIPQTLKNKVLVANFENNTYALEVADKLRNAQINTELYLKADKLSKQFKYANQNKMSFVIIAGDNEAKEQKITLKNMATGNQDLLSLSEAFKIIRQE